MIAAITKYIQRKKRQQGGKGSGRKEQKENDAYEYIHVDSASKSQ